MHLAFFGGMPGGGEVLIILFVILLLFGGKKLPELARSLGRSLSELRKGMAEGAHNETDAAKLKYGESEQGQGPTSGVGQS